MSQNEEATSQPSLETLADKLQQALGTAFKLGGDQGKQVKNLLNGVWLGHALHPLLTDVPIGSWTVGVGLDWLSLFEAQTDTKQHSGLAKGADRALELGILGALGAAVTGLTDWSDTYGKERSTGLIHMLLNTGALSANCLSWVLRKTGQRKLAIVVSTAAFGVTSYSAYLGGELVFNMGSMVNHNAWSAGVENWTPVMEASALAENSPTRVEVDNNKILLVRQEGKVYALAETCSHAGGPLSEGQLEGDTIICPWHASRFCLKDGRVLDGPATFKAPVYQVQENDGQIEVKLEQSH